MVVHAVGLDVELTEDPAARLVATGVAADDHLLAVHLGHEATEGDEVAYLLRWRRLDVVDEGDRLTVVAVHDELAPVRERQRTDRRQRAVHLLVDLHSTDALESG